MHNEELARQVAYWTAQGWLVASTTETTAVLHKPKPKVNHVLHLVISIFTCFLWAPVWLVMALIYTGGVETKTITAPPPASPVPSAPPAVLYAPPPLPISGGPIYQAPTNTDPTYGYGRPYGYADDPGAVSGGPAYGYSAPPAPQPHTAQPSAPAYGELAAGDPIASQPADALTDGEPTNDSEGPGYPASTR